MNTKNTSETAVATLPVTPTNGGWQPRPEILYAMKEISTIADHDDNAVITDTEITFENGGQMTTITASKVDLLTVDGYRISERFDIRSPLPFLEDLTDNQIAFANRLATTGAIIRYPNQRQPMLVSSLPVFEVDTVALKDLYIPVIANAALAQVYSVYALARIVMEEEFPKPRDIGIAYWDEPSYWRSDDFEYAIDRMRNVGIFCNAGESGLTAEFPWQEGSCSAMLGDTTSLMTFDASVAHPVAGNGLFYKLSLPLSLDEEQMVDAANVLNLFETTGVDVPPSIGAWCASEDGGYLSYVGFWPNYMYRYGTVANIASWCRVRSKIARQVLGNRGY